MKFKKEYLEAMAVNCHNEDVFEIISAEVDGISQWGVDIAMIFKFEGKFYITRFSRGAPNCPSSSPYAYQVEEIECVEVAPTEETITVYKELN